MNTERHINQFRSTLHILNRKFAKKRTLRAIVKLCFLLWIASISTSAESQVTEVQNHINTDPNFAEKVLNNISCIMGQDYTSDEMIGFIQDRSVDWKLSEFTSYPHWYANHGDLTYGASFMTDFEHGKKKYLHEFVIYSKLGSTPQLFSHFLKNFNIPDQPKSAEQALKKDGRYVECLVTKYSVQFILKETDELVVEIVWDRTDKKNLFIKELKFRRWELKDDCKTFLFPREEFSLSKWMVDANDPSTYWHLLGRELSSWEVRNLVFLHGLVQADRGLKNPGDDIEYMIVLNEKEGGFKVDEIYYYPGNEGITPFGQGKAWTRKELEEKYGKPYKSFNYLYRLYGSHWLSDEASRFLVDFELVGNPTPSTTSIAFKPFDTDSFISIPPLDIDALVGEHCVFGDCDTGVGISQFSDGYRFVGQFKNGKRSYGYVKDLQGNRVGDIDNRPPKKEPIDPNEHKKSIRAALSAINGSQDQVWKHWKSYVDNSSKMYVAASSEEREKYFGYSRKDLENLLVLCHTLNKRYAEAKSVIYEGDLCLGLVSNINDLSKVRDDVFDLTNAVSLGSFNKPTYKSFTDYMEPKYNEMVTLCKEFEEQWKDLAVELNDCVND